MSDLMFQVKITATGVVKDKDGNILSSGPIEFDPQVMSEQEIHDIFQGDSK